MNGYPKVDEGKEVGKYDELIYGWVSYVKDDNENFLKYGTALLMFAIEVNDLKLIDDIYKKCLRSFEKGPEKNKAFLSIITTSMSLLNAYYPEYVERYSSDTNMIIDSSDYKIEHLSTSHLYPFSSNIKIINCTPIFWTKYIYRRMTRIIDDSSKRFISKKINLGTSEKTERTITFMIPYIKFVNYPQKHAWREFIRPQPSPFIKTINREIYKTWNGEALINFKWKTYGRYYYIIIWMEFFDLLGCFTIATTLSDDFISEDIRKRLSTASIILGLYHVFNEIRQIIYNPKEWIHDFWNIGGKYNIKLVNLFFIL